MAGFQRSGAGLVRYLWRNHRMITIAVTLSLIPRVLAALAFRPAQFTPDSFSYMAEGVHPGLSQWHPAGYPAFLWLLSPFHSLLLVTTVQHLLGIATAVIVYAVLRRWDLPAWGATLAACPVLFDSRQVALEASILPDVVYALILTLAVAALLTRRAPSPGRCAVAGLVTTPDRDRVTGVRVSPADRDEEEIAADLVADATGRGSRTTDESSARLAAHARRGARRMAARQAREQRPPW